MSKDNNNNNDIIFTTAFKDINRGNWSYFTKSNEEYINLFCNLANNIKYKLIIYVENDMVELIKQNQNNKFSGNTNIIFIDMKSVFTFYDKYLENDTIIINSSDYKNQIPDHRRENPEHLYSSYNLINHSKINFVRNTKKLFPSYTYYSWIDFGAMNTNIENIPNDIDISLLQHTITYHCVKEPPSIRISEIDMLKSDEIYFLGSAFIVYTDLVEKFEELWENKIIEWQAKNITDDDQNLILQLYYDFPDLFSKIQNTKWFGIFTKLKYQKIDVF
jgi:hypothetical protein